MQIKPNKKAMRIVYVSRLGKETFERPFKARISTRLRMAPAYCWNCGNKIEQYDQYVAISYHASNHKGEDLAAKALYCWECVDYGDY